MRNVSMIGVVAFLFIFSGIIPVAAYKWGSPLATDTVDDAGIDPPEDMRSVDALYADGFVLFRFVLDYYFIDDIYCAVYCDFDKNSLTGFNASGWPFVIDTGADFYLYAEVLHYVTYPSDIALLVGLTLKDYTDFHVYYNMTANNGTAFGWSDPAAVPKLPWLTLINSSQAEVVFGVNWMWITELMATAGVPGDNISMYFEFETGWDSDWCPDRTAGSTDYIEWTLTTEGGGIPGFSLGFVLIGLLNLLGIPVLLQKKQKKF